MRADHSWDDVGELVQFTVREGTTRPSICGPSCDEVEPPRKSEFPKYVTSSPCIGEPSGTVSKVWSYW